MAKKDKRDIQIGNTLYSPINREEAFMSAIANRDDQILLDMGIEPTTRHEAFLQAMVESAMTGGGTGGTGNPVVADVVEFDDSIANLGTDNVQDAIDILTAKTPKLDEDNVFTGKNTFNDVHIKSDGVTNDIIYKFANTNLTSAMPSSQYTVTKSEQVDSGKYVDKVMVAIYDGIQDASVTGVRMFAMDVTNNMVIEDIVVDGTFTVVQGNDAEWGNNITKYIEIPVHKRFNVDVCFGFSGGDCIAWGENRINANTSAGTPIPQLNTVISSNTFGTGTGRFTTAVKVLSKELSFKDTVDKTNELDRELEKCAKLDEDSVFTGIPTFTDGIIKSDFMIDRVVNNALTYAMRSTGYYACKDVSVDMNESVSRLIIAVHNSVAINSYINDVSIYSIDYGTGLVLDEIVSNYRARVIPYTEADLGTDRVIEIPINSLFPQKTTFAICGTGIAWSYNGVDATASADDTRPIVNNTLQFVKSRDRWIGAYKIMKEDMSFHNILSDLEVLSEELTEYVHPSRENFIKSKTVIADGYTNTRLYTLNNENPNLTPMNNANTVFASKDMNIPSGQELTRVVIGVDPNLSVGALVTGVSIGVARKDNGIVQDYMVENGTYPVQENSDPLLTNCTRVIVVDLKHLNLKWNDDMTLIVGGIGVLWGDRNNGEGGDTHAPDKVAINSPLSFGSNNGKWNGKVVMYGGELPLTHHIVDVDCNAPNVLTFKRADGTTKIIDIAQGTVTQNWTK